MLRYCRDGNTRALRVCYNGMRAWEPTARHLQTNKDKSRPARVCVRVCVCVWICVGVSGDCGLEINGNTTAPINTQSKDNGRPARMCACLCVCVCVCVCVSGECGVASERTKVRLCVLHGSRTQHQHRQQETRPTVISLKTAHSARQHKYAEQGTAAPEATSTQV